MKGKRYLDQGNEALVDIAARLAYSDMPTALASYEQFFDTPKRAADIALLGCLDRFFLCGCILGRRDLVHPWIYDRCREVEAAPDGYLDLWAREHGKSSLITCAGVIQEVLIDPELTVAIFSGTQKSARKFLHQIKREFETNPILRAAYADVVWTNPKQDAPRWGLDGIVLRRASNPKEATVEAWGLIDGMPTGGHYGLLVYDDIVTLETVRNPDMVRKATESWEMSDNLGSGDVRKQHIGTRPAIVSPAGSDANNCVWHTPFAPPQPPACATGNHAATLLHGPGSKLAFLSGTYHEHVSVAVSKTNWGSLSTAFKSRWPRRSALAA